MKGFNGDDYDEKLTFGEKLLTVVTLMGVIGFLVLILILAKAI